MYSFNISIYSILILQTILHYLEVYTLNGKAKRQMRSENSEKSKRGFGMVTFSASAISELYFSLQISLLNIAEIYKEYYYLKTVIVQKPDLCRQV